MSFTLALLMVVAIGAIGLGLICVHLLGRLELLERAVQGGLEAPSTRLSREQFERRFAVAHARAALAAGVVTGVVIVFGPEADDEHELVQTLVHLARPDHVFVLFATDRGMPLACLADFARPVVDLDPGALGVTTTPFAFVVDEAQVRGAQPLVSAAELLSLLHERT